jgi:phosphoribosylanthranilate isomerase
MRPRVKICGVRRAADARLAVALGADLIGCVLAEDSPRRARMVDVRAVHRAIDGRAELVLVFRRATAEQALAACRAAGTDRVQVHEGDAALVAQLLELGLRPTRVFAVAEGALPPLEPPPTPSRPALLDISAGRGRRFDWRLRQPRAPAATFVAGGIDAQNVTELLRSSPYGIDVSSGVETAPGIKDPARLQALFAQLEDRR